VFKGIKKVISEKYFDLCVKSQYFSE